MRSEGNAPKKGRTSSRFLLHDNAPAHRSGLVKDFLAKNNVTTLKHHPYSLDLAAATFDLSPPLKSELKRWFFCREKDIKNAMEELKMPPQNGFHECFQHIHRRWRKYEVA
jgi:transposase